MATNVAVQTAGVQETKDALIAMNEVGLTMAKLFSDGTQFADFIAIWKKLSEDETFKTQLVTAYEGWNAISNEIADLDVNEALDLVSVQLSYIPRFVEAVAKNVPAVPAVPAAPAAGAAMAKKARK